MAGVLQGTVKSFSLRDPETKKGGYGFIVSEQMPSDVWFGHKDLAEDLLEAIENRLLTIKERVVVFEMQQSPDGKPKAANVKLFPALNEKMAGKVRSYASDATGKGFGFFTCSSLEGQDVYFSKKDLPPAQSMISIQPGTTASFTLTQLADGKLQAKEVQLVFTAGLLSMLTGGDIMQAMMGKGGMRSNGGGGNTLMQMMQGGGGSVQQSTTERAGLQGMIAKFFPEKGFGFIQSPAHPGVDIYFKGNGLIFEAGQAVSFTLTYTSDGKPQAKNLSAALQEGQTLDGIIRSFVSNTGYGFITVADRDVDVYFKGDKIPAPPPDGNYVGRQVRFTVTMTKDGKPQVAEIHALGEVDPTFVPSSGRGVKRSIDGGMAGMTMGTMGMIPDMAGGAPETKRQKVTVPVTGEMLYGSIKSFNPEKGYGFIVSPTTGGDVFFLRTSLPLEHQRSEALQGFPVQFYVAMGQDGRQQAEGINFG
mmetsp:Transcript_24270/g.56354  ORF Transcript_24270/g.56354 Transcript_24270/m.56354 type:complete len:476 (-) Transcript_24270:147-1574(-)